MKVLAFSGGCFSGKTTAMTAIADLLRSHNVKVIVGNELARQRKEAVFIDALRNNQDNYFKFECDIINKKIVFEQQLQKRYSEDVVVLLDRALTDSLMYFNMYINPDKLNDVNLDAYLDFKNTIAESAFNSFSDLYTHVIEFLPIDALCYKQEDIVYRPNRVDALKHIEYNAIRDLNENMYRRVERTRLVNRLKYIRTKIDVKNGGIEQWLNTFINNNPDIILL